MAYRTFKIVMLGDGAVGKTSLVRRFVEKMFDDQYITTIGTNVKKKKLDELDVKLMIWDLYGQKLNTKLQSSNIIGADGALIVYDLTRMQTFKSLDDWIQELFKVTGEIPFVVMGNKYDLLEEFLQSDEEDTLSDEGFQRFMKRRHKDVIEYYKQVYNEKPDFEAVPLEELTRWGEEKNDSLDTNFSYYKTSAKTGENVEEAFRELAKTILKGVKNG